MPLSPIIIGDTEFNTSRKPIVFLRTDWLTIVHGEVIIADFLIFNDLQLLAITFNVFLNDFKSYFLIQ